MGKVIPFSIFDWQFLIGKLLMNYGLERGPAVSLFWGTRIIFSEFKLALLTVGSATIEK